MSSSRDPRIYPRPGDILRRETDYLGRLLICEVISVDRYGVRYKANGVMQSSCSVSSWTIWATEAIVTHKAEA